MAETPRLICASADLAEAGAGVRFTVLRHGQETPAFAIRFRGKVYAYINQCGHVPAQLDWQPGEFFDYSKLYLVCSIHGALYAPESGACLSGRCQRVGLRPLPVEEREGFVTCCQAISMDNSPTPPDAPAAWERQTLEKLAFAALDEQRRRHKWGIFFKILGFIYLAVILAAFVDWGGSTAHEEKHTAVIHLHGVIDSRGEASAEKLVSALQEAFEEKNAVGVVLRINSPGGSPVQAGMVNDEIRRLRAKYPDKPLHAVVEDLCASGGYYVAVAADKIYVNKASIVGSIGVLMDGFGFTGTMDKLGVERRLLTAGENKGFLDPFLPQEPRHKAHAQVLLNDIHKQFIDVVKAGRGKRLKETPDMFSGLMWTGAQSIELGLADDYGSVESVARDVIKAEKVVDYTVKDNIAERFAKRLGAGAASSLWNGFFAESAGVRLR